MSHKMRSVTQTTSESRANWCPGSVCTVCVLWPVPRETWGSSQGLNDCVGGPRARTPQSAEGWEPRVTSLQNSSTEGRNPDFYVNSLLWKSGQLIHIF